MRPEHRSACAGFEHCTVICGTVGRVNCHSRSLSRHPSAHRSRGCQPSPLSLPACCQGCEWRVRLWHTIIVLIIVNLHHIASRPTPRPSCTLTRRCCPPGPRAEFCARASSKRCFPPFRRPRTTAAVCAPQRQHSLATAHRPAHPLRSSRSLARHPPSVFACLL